MRWRAAVELHRAPPRAAARRVCAVLPPLSSLRSFRAPARMRGMSPLARFFLPPPSLRALRSAASCALPSISARCFSASCQVVPDRRELDGLAFAVAAPIAAISRGAERGQLDDGVHGLEQLAVMADDDRAAAPASEEIDHGSRPSRSRLLVGSSSSRKSGSAKSSAARRARVTCPPDKRSKFRFERRGRARHGPERTRAAPRASSRHRQASSAEASPRSARRSRSSASRAPKRSTTDSAGTELDVLAQEADGAVDRTRAGCGAMLAGDRGEQRCLADAIAADKTGSLGRRRSDRCWREEDGRQAWTATGSTG